MDQEESVILVTGYKAHELGIFSSDHPGVQVICYALKQKMKACINNGAKWFVISGQTGVELWAGQVCLDLRDKEKMDVKLAVLMPFLNQEEHYKEWQQELYNQVLDQADYCGAISDRPYESPVQLRQKNTFLIAKTDAMLIVYDEETPGSPNYYLSEARKKARNQPYPIWTLNRFDLDYASEDMVQQNPEYWSQGE
ncbi:SLOG family protein [Sporolactobacillus kofuensis]|uniref:SLOG family protein n=1 Tax=Sporolactobacillus kofuensis TaxID=269672 RepID=A0ABW1WED9_9BACL|nr:SLOG family protein [Sporolactobacillus kofuensis]MCO7176213.1 SLOG family protein [Sporolactobacillus kofuensis]